MAIDERSGLGWVWSVECWSMWVIISSVERVHGRLDRL